MIKKSAGIPIHERITYFRKLSGLTQAEMAKKIKMTAGNYGKIERGEIGVPYSYLEKIAETCKVPITTLISQYAEELEKVIASKDKQILELQEKIIGLLSKGK